MKVLVLTTSYPRGDDDPAGRFVASAVESARARGIEVEVVSPADFRHFGIAYGHGIVGNLRRRPWLVLLVPVFLWNFRRAADRDCDLVHAHWLAAGAVAATLRRPYVVQVWGTDVELARRVPWACRWILRRARLVLAASRFLADEAAITSRADPRTGRASSGTRRASSTSVPHTCSTYGFPVARAAIADGIQCACTRSAPRAAARAARAYAATNAGTRPTLHGARRRFCAMPSP